MDWERSQELTEARHGWIRLSRGSKKRQIEKMNWQIEKRDSEPTEMAGAHGIKKTSEYYEALCLENSD